MKFKKFYGKRVVEPESLAKFYLELSMIESIIEVDGIEAITYGVQINKLDPEGGKILEIETICDITPDKPAIEKVARKLFDSEVEPVILHEIVSDYVDSLEYLSV